MEQLATWANQVGIDTLINRRGTTWRSLSNEDKALADQIDSALILLHQHPTLIKRPVVENNGHVLVGFSEHLYAQEWQ